MTEPTDTSGGQSTSGRQKARVRVRRRATRVVIHKEFCPPHTSPNSRKGEDNEVIKFLSQNEAEVRVLSVDEPAPCLYELLVCREFRDEEGKVYGGEGGSAVADNAKRNSLGKREDDYHVDSDGGRKVGTGAETGETPILDCSEKKLGNPEDDSGGGDIDRGEEEDETGDKISKTMHTDSDLSETIILGESDNDNDVESTKKASEVEVKTKADPEVQSDESTNGACMEGATDGQGSPPQTQSSSSPAAREAEEILLQYLHEAERGQDRRRSDNSGSNSDTYFNGAGTASDAFPPFPPSKAEENLRTIEVMFQRSYDSYMYNAYPLGELRPISCKGGHFNLVKLPALTLIDALDTLILMGNYTEFARSAERLRILDNQKREEFGEMFPTFTDPGGLKNAGLFAANQNVSLFETNIRVLGGLLGAHQLAEAHTVKKVLLVDVFNKEGGVRIGNHGPVPVQCDHGSCAGAETELRTGDISSSDRPFCLASSRNGAAEAEYDVLNSRPTTLIPDVSMGSRRNGGNGSGSGGQCLLNDEAAPASSTRRKAKANLNSTSSAECGRGRGFVDDAAGIGAAAKTTASLMDYWSYDGFLLTLAHDIGLRLLPAFSTETGIPYGTVNLLYGIPPDETTIASLAGAGTLTLEMELLSRLTGDPSFGAAARLASRALWTRRSANLDLLGKHIDVHTGRWTETLSGIGSNSDSYYEYLIKHHTLFPDDGADFWPMFLSIYDGVHQNSREGEWYPDVDMNAGVGRGGRHIFESLMAFYPGMQVLLGELSPASRSLNGFFLVRELLGFLPERFNYGRWAVDEGGGVHPLRPELLESCYFLHRASRGFGISTTGVQEERNKDDDNGEGNNAKGFEGTDGHDHIGGNSKDKNNEGHSARNRHMASESTGWQWAADFALHNLYSLSGTKCGHAAIHSVGSTSTGSIASDIINGEDLGGGAAAAAQRRSERKVRLADDMPSYFLSETLKYLYLTFDDKNVLHTDQEREWVFNTEAHPLHHVPPLSQKLEKKQQQSGSGETQGGQRSDGDEFKAEDSAKQDEVHLRVMENKVLDLLRERVLLGTQDRATPPPLPRRQHRDGRGDDVDTVHTGIGYGSRGSIGGNGDDVVTLLPTSGAEMLDTNRNIWTFKTSQKKYEADLRNTQQLRLDHRRGRISADGGELKLAAPGDHASVGMMGFVRAGMLLGPTVPQSLPPPQAHRMGGEGVSDSSTPYEEELFHANTAYLTFRHHRRGTGLDLPLSCPNHHHPSLRWVHALRGEGLDYTDFYVTSMTDDGDEEEDSGGDGRGDQGSAGMDMGYMTALAAAGLYGTGLSPSRAVDSGTAGYDLCLIDSAADGDAASSDGGASRSAPKGEGGGADGTVEGSPPSPDAQRFDMGDDLGQFDISTFNDGVGFFVKHINSGETVEVSVVDGRVSGGGDSHALVSSVIKTRPERRRATDIGGGSRNERSRLALTWRSIFGRTPLEIFQPAKAELTLTEEGVDAVQENFTMVDKYPRQSVVMADLEGNSFVCDIQLKQHRMDLKETSNTVSDGIGSEKSVSRHQSGVHSDELLPSIGQNKGNVIRTFPCAPALFGPTRISSLIQTDGITLEAELLAPDQEDEYGCHSEPGDSSVCEDPDIEYRGHIQNDPDAFNDSEFTPESLCGENSEVRRTMGVTQLVLRGECLFQSKVWNQWERHNKKAEAVIVINSDPEQLFVMSGPKDAYQRYDDNGKEPVSVLVSGNDGDEMKKILLEHSSKSRRSKENQSNQRESEKYFITATVRLQRQSDTTDEDKSDSSSFGGVLQWPLVRSTKNTLQIFAANGWGIHAMSQPDDTPQMSASKAKKSWQLFILKHNQGLL